MSSELVTVERANPLATVTINRPAIHNALNRQTLEQLKLVAAELQSDNDVRAIILTGAGSKSFVAGADINEFVSDSPSALHELSRTGQRVFDLIENLGKPVIAAVNGYALGGGCELAMACTMRLAADTAIFGLPEINLGMMPGYGGTQRLSRLVGKGKALEMILTGRPISAVEAARIGLVNEVVKADELLGRAGELAAFIAGKAPLAVRYSLQAINTGVELPLPQALVLEATLFGMVTATEDMREGTRAFLDKRKAAFTGR